MTTATAPSALAANLAGLGDINADVVERLRTAVPAALEFTDTPQGCLAASWNGRPLCSRHRPQDEARRLVDDVNLVENAVVVVMGFGLGYHVQRLAERLGRTGFIVVFEPDVDLLRATLDQIDHSAWLAQAPVVFVTDEQDRATLAGKLQGAESIVAQGVAFVEHPPSRVRLGERAGVFSTRFREFVQSARTTLVTTLVRSTETVRNLLLNMDHYAGGAGIADLEGVAAGAPAIVVSAGPSLHRHLEQLAHPETRERAVIIAVQTTLKPLLAAGVRPHFVTALDYHEISKRFYEQLDPAAVAEVTLVADPKAHPVILDAFPGPVRCCSSAFLDRVLGPAERPMGELPPGATVAHLSLYLARYLGCNPIVLVGQDLGFTDGLYYAPGTAIDDVWAPELNPFNTIEMMQWQRIARHRMHLTKTTDARGRSVYTDAQMLAYLQQFERDFADLQRAGIRVIDATGGGVAKQHVEVATLDAALASAPASHAGLPRPTTTLDATRLAAAGARLEDVQRDIDALRRAATRTIDLLRAMLRDQADTARMDRHFAKLAKERAEVEARLEAFELLNHLNQMGAFNRLRADRRLQMQPAGDPVAQQRGELERDLANVTWIADAATELLDQLATARRLVGGETVPHRRAAPVRSVTATATGRATTVAALVPIDPARSGLDVPRDLGASLAGRAVLQCTLERLGRSETIDSIVLIAPAVTDDESRIDRDAIGRPVEIETVERSPFGPERAAIAAARRWADTSWRGGIAGASALDEVICPALMAPIMTRRRLDAAVLVGPDWPLVTVTGDHGCDALVRRHREHPDEHRLVVTQAPPGLCGGLVSAALMDELAQRNRLATIGALLVYQPHAPQSDPIAKDMTVQIDPVVRNATVRGIFDDPWSQRAIRDALAAQPALLDADPAAIVAALAGVTPDRPREVTLEVTTRVAARGRFHALRGGRKETIDLDVAQAATLFDELDPATLLTFDGAGDPLLHPRFDAMLAAAHERGLRVHVRTALPRDVDAMPLLAGAVDVLSVDLHADTPETYRTMMGEDRFLEVLATIDALVAARPTLAGPEGAGGFALPWILPRLLRCAETVDEMDHFYDRWQLGLGVCLLDGAPPPGAPTVAPAVTPPAAVRHRLRRRLTVLADGSIPVSETDRSGVDAVGRVGTAPLATHWRELLARRARGEAATWTA